MTVATVTPHARATARRDTPARSRMRVRFLRLGQLGRHHLSHEVGDGLWDRWSGKRHEVARYTPAERWLASISADP